jgi:hypothetical protein
MNTSNMNTSKLYGRTSIVISAAGAAFGLWGLSVPIAGTELRAPRGGTPEPVGAAAVVLAALLAGLAAWALLALLERRARRPRRTWTITAAAVLALSLTGPLGAEGTGNKLTLIGLHLVVGAVLLAGMPRTVCPPATAPAARTGDCVR